MNGFIDEVVTQGTLMQEVGRYYRGAGLQSIQAIVAAYQERGCNQVNPFRYGQFLVRYGFRPAAF